VLEIVLRKQGYRVLSARTPQQAVLLADQHGDDVDLLLLDLMLPGMTGNALAEQLSIRYPNMRAIYMSGYNDSIAVDHGLSSDVTFLQKPMLTPVLIETVRKVLDSAWGK